MSRNRGNAHSKKRICPLSTGKTHVHRALAAPTNGSFVLVTGETGIGKTRFLKELPRQTEGAAHRRRIHPSKRVRYLLAASSIQSKGLPPLPTGPKSPCAHNASWATSNGARLGRCLIPSIDINVDAGRSTLMSIEGMRQRSLAPLLVAHDALCAQGDFGPVGSGGKPFD